MTTELTIGDSNMDVQAAETTEMDVEDDARGVALADGGLVAREFNEVRHSDELVRDYLTPSGDHLYAYRSDDQDHHIVVSRGSDPGTKWEERVPATVGRPVPGQKLWTIPDNWEKRVHSKRDTIAYGLFYVPDSDVWARVSIPTNDWLVDACYGVNAVGDLDAEPVGELGSIHNVRQLADDYEEKHDSENVEEDAEAIREVASNWEVVEEDLRRTTGWVRDEGLEHKAGYQPLPVDRDWQIEFRQDRIFRPGEAIEQAVDLSNYGIPKSAILEELRDADLLPSYYSFELALDDSTIDMEYYVRGLIEAGCTPPQALDYYMTEIVDLSQSEWGRERGKKQPSISKNVSGAEDAIKS